MIFEDPDKILRILAGKWKIHEDLGKKMKDPWRSWQEFGRSSNIFSKIIWRSSKFLSRSLKIQTRSSRNLTGKWKILEDLGKIFRDPWRSWQENERSLKILTRIWRSSKIFPRSSWRSSIGSSKVLMKISMDPQRSF